MAALEALDGPAAVIRPDGAILAGNTAGLDLLATERGDRARGALVRALASHDDAPVPGVTRAQIPGADAALCRFSPGPEDASSD